MNDGFAPVTRQSLSDRLAVRIRELMRAGEYGIGDRLPAIMEMARRFGVGHPTIREALMKLETMGLVEIRHGSGVYVMRTDDVLLVATPALAAPVSKSLLLDLIRTRQPLELAAVVGAVGHATAPEIAEMRRLLETGRRDVEIPAVMQTANREFHRRIAAASGNGVLAQLLAALHDLYPLEQQLVLDIGCSRLRTCDEHLAILDAIEQRSQSRAENSMRDHLAQVERAIRNWDPAEQPLARIGVVP